jgi:hypothetical protein
MSFYLPTFYPRELVSANVYPSPSPPTRRVHGFLTTSPSPPLSDNVTSISQITAGGESFISLSPLSMTENDHIQFVSHAKLRRRPPSSTSTSPPHLLGLDAMNHG